MIAGLKVCESRLDSADRLLEQTVCDDDACDIVTARRRVAHLALVAFDNEHSGACIDNISLPETLEDEPAAPRQDEVRDLGRPTRAEVATRCAVGDIADLDD